MALVKRSWTVPLVEYVAGSPSPSAAEVGSRFGRSGQAEPATGCVVQRDG